MENLIAKITFGCATFGAGLTLCLCLIGCKPRNSGCEYRIMMNGYDQYRAELQHRGRPFWPYVWTCLTKWDSDIGIAVVAIEQHKTKFRKDKIYVKVPTAL